MLGVRGERVAFRRRRATPTGKGNGLGARSRQRLGYFSDGHSALVVLTPFRHTIVRKRTIGFDALDLIRLGR